MFPTHTSRRTRNNGINNDYNNTQQPPQSWDYQSSPPYSQQYPSHTVPGYAYPSKYNAGSDNGTNPPSQPYQDRAPFPQWSPSKLQRGYERDNGSQDGKYLDGSQHSYRGNSEGESDYRQQEVPIQTENPPARDPYARYQQYQYQNPSPESQNTSIDTPLECQPSNRYYSQDTSVEYQPYIPERPSRTNNHAAYNKWTPPARLQQFISPDTCIQSQRQDNQESAHIEPPTMIPPQSEPVENGDTHHAQNESSDQKFYPGHPAYKWTPPVVLQVFQEQSIQYPDPLANSKYASHSHSHMATDHGAILNPPQPPLSQSQVTNSFSQDFVDWAKLQPSQNVVARLTQENIPGDSVRNRFGNSLLHSACEVGNISLIYSLLEMYDPQHFATYNEEGMFPLHVACKHNMKFIIMFLIKNKIVNGTEPSSDGSSPLYIASKFNALDVVDYLLTILPSQHLWTENSSGLTPLHVAAIEGHLKVLQRLSPVAGVELTRADSVDGRTCLHWAAMHRHYEVIKFLVQDQKIDLNQVDKFGHTAEQIHSDAVTKYLIHGTFPQNHPPPNIEEVVASPKSASKSYTPPANPSFLPKQNQSDEEKLAASRERSLNKMKSKETVETPGKRWDCHGFTNPSEVQSDASDVVKFSVGVTERPAVVGKLNVKDNWRKSSDDEGRQYKGENDAVQVIRSGEHQSGSTDVESPTEVKPQNVLMLFDWVAVDNKIPELEGYLGVTPDIKMDVNSIKHPETGESLLHVACRKGHLAVAQFLVEGVGSNVNNLDNNGATPLHDAVQGSSVLIVRYLVKYCGALLDITNNNGQTALDICKSMEQTDDRDEIARIISKSIGKSPEKRTKITLPSFQSKN